MKKLCPKCEMELSTDKFNKANRRDGYQSYCRSCHNKMQRDRYHSDPVAKIKHQMRYRKRKSKNPLAQREAELKKLYGITLQDYIEMYNDQDGVCYICKEECKTKKSLSVDHNHKTGRVRGLLCNRCNRAIGMFMDSPSLLRRAADYLDIDDI